MEKHAVEVEHVTFSYDGLPVLEDVNLVIKERDFVSVVGPNGGGKTTLLKLFLGLLHPEKGVVRVFGATPEEARPRIGYMPQSPVLDPRFPIRVEEVVSMGRLGKSRSLAFYSREDREAVARALHDVEIDELRLRPFHALSGGQRQRVLIARALVSEPDLLLLDEPTIHFDPAIETDFYELLQELNKRLTIVTVSHDLGFVSQFVKSVVCVKRKVVVHPTSEITGEIIQEIYGEQVRMIRHDHRCSEGGHEWPNS